MTPLLAVRDLGVEFATDSGRLAAVADLCFDLAAGECLGIVGESGSGKTQACMALMGLLPANAAVSGRALFGGRDLLRMPRAELNRVRGAQIAMIFQDPMLSMTPHLRIGQQLAEVLVEHRGASWREARGAALDMLARVKMTEPARRMLQYPHELSGGMRQRAMIAMALLCKPKLLIADEATTALDVTIQAQIIGLLREMRQELGTAIVFISHDIALLANFAARLIVMYAGRCVASGPTAELLQRPRHPYLQGLIAAVPRLGGARLSTWPTIAGQAPDMTRFAAGCTFAPRCTRAAAQCRQVRPLLYESGVHSGAGAAVQSVACHFPLDAPPA